MAFEAAPQVVVEQRATVNGVVGNVVREDRRVTGRDADCSRSMRDSYWTYRPQIPADETC